MLVTPRQIAPALGTQVVGNALAVTLDSQRLHAALAPQLTRFESPPVDASFAVTEQNTVRVIASRDGREIDMPATPNPPEKMKFQFNLRRRGISDQAVLRAMEEIPRDIFVDRADRANAGLLWPS